jgi:hypothetical protein
MRKLILVLGTLLVVGVALPRRADAAVNNIEPTAKGIIGLGLLAGELVVNIEALAGVKKAWILALTGIIAAGGGAVGGYFIETKLSRLTASKVCVGLLAGGMAMLVPTFIIVATKTRFSVKGEGGTTEVEVVKEKSGGEPAAGAKESAAPAKEGGPAPEKKEGGAAASRLEEPAPVAVFNVTRSRFAVAVPALQVAPIFDEKELAFFTRKQAYEYRFGLVNVVF